MGRDLIYTSSDFPYSIKLGRQCTTIRRVRVGIFAVKKQLSITYYERVSNIVSCTFRTSIILSSVGFMGVQGFSFVS